MIRGRRGIAVAIFLFFAFCSIPTAWAFDMGMTATVPLSSTWKTLIEENTTATLDTRSHRNIAKLSLQVQGIGTVTLPKQRVQALLFHDMGLVDNQIKETDEEGNIDFTFVYKTGERYRAIVVDTSDEEPFVIKTIFF